jgi:SAM-dependent methyltransferase
MKIPAIIDEQGYRHCSNQAWYSRYCPVCRHWSEFFIPHGVVPRPDAECPSCGSVERHRMIWTYFVRHSKLFDGTPKQMLHIAPEALYAQRLNRVARLTYISGDLASRIAMTRLDVTALPFPDNTFDVVYCGHVLEHVRNDIQAMDELFRVLRPNGWAVIQVPITVPRTIETIVTDDPQERIKHYGHPDHVRRYGPDYILRLESAGFEVESINATAFINNDDLTLMAIRADGRIFRCTK